MQQTALCVPYLSMMLRWTRHFFVVFIIKSFLSGIAQIVSNPPSLYDYGHVFSRKSSSISKMDKSNPASTQSNAFGFVFELIHQSLHPIISNSIKIESQDCIWIFASKHHSNWEIGTLHLFFLSLGRMQSIQCVDNQKTPSIEEPNKWLAAVRFHLCHSIMKIFLLVLPSLKNLPSTWLHRIFSSKLLASSPLILCACALFDALRLFIFFSNSPSFLCNASSLCFNFSSLLLASSSISSKDISCRVSCVLCVQMQIFCKF